MYNFKSVPLRTRVLIERQNIKYYTSKCQRVCDDVFTHHPCTRLSYKYWVSCCRAVAKSTQQFGHVMQIFSYFDPEKNQYVHKMTNSLQWLKIKFTCMAWPNCWAVYASELKACSNEANIMQHCMMLDEILSKFKIKPTFSDMVFKRGQHVASNNVGWCWTNMLASFEQALKFIYPVYLLKLFHGCLFT